MVESVRWMSLVIFVCAVCVPGPLAAVPPPPEVLAGPYKVNVADFTGDGVADLAVTHYPSGVLTIEEGDRRGRFRRLSLTVLRVAGRDARPGGSGDSIYNIAHGDIDGDGLLDLAVGLGRFVVVARNMGKGQWQQKQEYRPVSDGKGVRLVDLDRDGKLDLLYTARGTGRSGDTPSGTLTLRRGLGKFLFDKPIDRPAGISAYYVHVADLNGDGFIDVLVPNELGTTVSYWLHPGRGVFAAGQQPKRQTVQTSGKRINDVRAADFNNDGHLDLVSANWATSGVSVFLGRGDGSFGTETRYDGGKHCVFFDTGDFDRDGDLDFVVTHWTENFMSVFLNRGDGSFSPRKDYRTGLGNYGVQVLDADGDRRLDVVTANYRERTLTLLRGTGDGTFQAARIIARGVRREGTRWVSE